MDRMPWYVQLIVTACGLTGLALGWLLAGNIGVWIGALVGLALGIVLARWLF